MHQLALARRGRVKCFQCHRSLPHRPVVTSMRWPSSSVTIARLTSDCVPMRAAERLDLALADQRVDALDLDVEQLLDRFLDLRLGGVRARP